MGKQWVPVVQCKLISQSFFFSKQPSFLYIPVLYNKQKNKADVTYRFNFGCHLLGFAFSILYTCASNLVKKHSLNLKVNITHRYVFLADLHKQFEINHLLSLPVFSQYQYLYSTRTSKTQIRYALGSQLTRYIHSSKAYLCISLSNRVPKTRLINVFILTQKLIFIKF